MTNSPRRQSDGFYHVRGKKYKLYTGSRVQVFNETAFKTNGYPGLKKQDIFRRDFGHGKTRYLSRKKHFSAKRENRLQKYGWGAQRGKFGAVRLDSHADSRASRRRRRTQRRRP